MDLRSLSKNPALIHPFLATTAMFMDYIGTNLDFFGAASILSSLPALLLVFLAGAALFLALKLVFRCDWLKLGFVFTIFIFLFFSLASAGMLLGILRSNYATASYLWIKVLEDNMALVLAFFYVPFLCFWIYQARKLNRADLCIATQILNALTIGTILYWIFQGYIREQEMQNVFAKISPTLSIDASRYRASEKSPDFYFIILDGCGSSRVFKDVYDYDNHDYLSKLTKLGFYVAKESKSNYLNTQQSLAASLNAAYLPDLDKIVFDKRVTGALLSNLISHSAVPSLLSKCGYKIYFVGSGDSTLIPFINADKSFQATPLNDLLLTFLDKSPLRFLDKIMPIIYLPARQAVLFAFDNVEQIVAQPCPKFVFMHINCPHPPFLFDHDGKQTAYPSVEYLGDGDWQLKSAYEEQEKYLESKMIPFLQCILKNSKRPPVIVVQGDHGPSALFLANPMLSKPETILIRSEILNAVFLPKAVETDSRQALELNQRIGPVNTIRLILDKYFGARLGLLEEKTYASNHRSMYEVSDCTRLLNDQSALAKPGH